MGTVAYSDERWRVTAERYEQMIETGVLTPDDKVELLDGEVVPMSPMGAWQMRRTFWVREALNRVLGPSWAVAQGFALTTERDSRPEPDVAVLSRAALRSGGVLHTAALVVEISDTTLTRDRLKSPIYAAAKVPEYWIVNRVNDVVEVLTEPAPDASTTTGFDYSMRRVARRGESLTCAVASGPVSVDELLGEASTEG